MMLPSGQDHLPRPSRSRRLVTDACCAKELTDAGRIRYAERSGAGGAGRVHDGWRRMDCYTPYPVEEAAEAIGFHRNKVPLITLVGG
jgi:hypothetical protein